MITFRSKLIDFPPYERGVYVFVCNSLTDAAKELDIPWDYSDDERFDAYCTEAKDNIYILYKNNVNRQTVLHECIHAINKIYNYIGAEISLDNDEVYVRDLCWLQEEVLKAVEGHVRQDS